MILYFRRLAHGVTYTRWLHLCIPVLIFSVWMFISIDTWYVPALVMLPVGLIPAVRLEEGLQAQLLLTPGERGRPDARIAAAASATWAQRRRVVLWIQARLTLSAVATLISVWLPVMAFDLLTLSSRATGGNVGLLTNLEPHWWYALLAPLPIVVMLACMPALGDVVTALARRLLGPSPKERLLALEERTEQLLERNRIARELHDSIGHALTVAVVQAAAARTANDPDFTERALTAIEETGREALDDLERVLRVLREQRTPSTQRPTLAEASRLFDSARASGVKLDIGATGPLTKVPGPVSREGYRILQESLTNVLRHSGAVPVRVWMSVADDWLELEVSNPLSTSASSPGDGSGLRGIRERAALLGGKAKTGPYNGEWVVRASLPLDRIR
ncbi:two-component sensor histidine kinase [Streptomyces agglomeratus]|uniref:histidine kinase n=1 Tax=Streptomyces agglomeratus TaxID=285458 RepID=A0A1E5PEV5_9ACTN|nr:histidine kinase [Streptomyces agglomeratus]OEJ28046.1 two-component sensor histidine kinase [Streptomyces agglomeratus]OEJ37892.1 two-component sensor histidine kinase [Streptomyces agglomeratus]OEJ47724.1 two-component sensor histidine kinase [Streptomyces agglomeratus]OEJ57771.1 two-component sensor histidine kinase [Streptomyces agglomeratus]